MSPITAKNKIGQPFIQFDTISSTNSYAIDSLQANLAAHGTTYFAYNQTEGKGQRGKKWLTEDGANIILSVIVDCSLLSIQHQFKLSAAVSLACFDFFSQFAGDETSIKWPNDIYWRDRKAAGILIENIVRGTEWTYAIIGIGMNINQTIFLPEAKNPVSLKQITGKHFNIIEMASLLCTYLENYYQLLLAEDFPNILANYNYKLYKVNQQVTLKKGSVSIRCIIDGVNEFGQLIVKGATLQSYNFGEVEWVI